MDKRRLVIWYKVITAVLIAWGLFFLFFGLKTFSNAITIFGHTLHPIRKDVLLGWVNALYAAILIGWGVTLWLIGRIAFKRDDKELKRVLAVGLFVWLAIEFVASLWFGVWMNAGVDVAVAVLFAVPLLKR